MQVKDLYTTKTHCRAGGGKLRTVMDFGELCLSGFVKPDKPDPETAPLELCIADGSGLLQLRHSVDPERMFRRYWYRSSRNEAMVRHLHDVLEWSIKQLKFGQDKVKFYFGANILDIGCNDGTLLKHITRYGYVNLVNLIGYEPSDAKTGDTVYETYYRKFFDPDHYLEYHDPARLIFTIAMFYDIDDPVEFAQGIKRCLADDGVWIIEMHYAPDMLRWNGFDAICHEHLTYYSLTSLEYVLRQADLRVLDVTKNKVNGGSFRVAVVHEQHPEKTSAAVAGMRQYERDTMHSLLEGFIAGVERNRAEMIEFLAMARLDHKMVMGYGASTKGNTLLQWYGLGKHDVYAIAERNPDKVGLETAGSRIPIISEEDMRKIRPDYLLMLPYHFEKAFTDRESEWLARGGKWIIPVPELKIIGMEAF